MRSPRASAKKTSTMIAVAVGTLLLLSSCVTAADVAQQHDQDRNQDHLNLSRNLQTSDYEARAFECDENNKAMNNSPAKRHGSLIRVCLEMTQGAIDQNVYIFKIANFKFVKGGDGDSKALVQWAVQNGADADDFVDQTDVTCEQGSRLCTIEATLARNFYDTDGPVKGEGEISLQFGDTRRRAAAATKTMLRVGADFGNGGQVDPQQQQQQHRHLQELAGRSFVNMQFYTDNGLSDTKEDIDDTKGAIKEQWHDAEPYLKFLYVLFCLVLLCLICCLCLGCIFWEQYCGREARRQRAKDRGEIVDEFEYEEDPNAGFGPEMYPTHDPYDDQQQRGIPPEDYSGSSSESDDEFGYDSRAVPPAGDGYEDEYDSRADPSEYDQSEIPHANRNADFSSASDSEEEEMNEESSDDDSESEPEDGGQLVPYKEKTSKEKASKSRNVPAAEEEESESEEEDDDDDNEKGALVPYQEKPTKKEKRKKLTKKQKAAQKLASLENAQAVPPQVPPPPASNTSGAIEPYNGESNENAETDQLVAYDNEDSDDQQAIPGQMVVRDESERQIVTKKNSRRKK